MNVEQVHHTVDDIRASIDDPETAHSMEDNLWAQVLASIALGNPNARELADAALHTQDIEFPRWCA